MWIAVVRALVRLSHHPNLGSAHLSTAADMTYDAASHFNGAQRLSSYTCLFHPPCWPVQAVICLEDADGGGPAMFGTVPLLQIPGTATQAVVSPGQLSSGHSSNPEVDLPPELHAVLEPAVASAAVMSSQVT